MTYHHRFAVIPPLMDTSDGASQVCDFCETALFPIRARTCRGCDYEGEQCSRCWARCVHPDMGTNMELCPPCAGPQVRRFPNDHPIHTEWLPRVRALYRYFAHVDIDDQAVCPRCPTRTCASKVHREIIALGADAYVSLELCRLTADEDEQRALAVVR